MALNWQTQYNRYHRYFVDVRKFYKKKKVRVYTEIVFSILTASFFLFFAIKPTIITISGLIRQIKDQETVTEKLDKKISDLNSAQNQYFAFESSLSAVEDALPQDVRASIFIKEVEALARRAGIRVDSLQFSELLLKETIIKEEQKEINFNLVVSGSYPGLKNFLTSFNLLRRVVLVDAFAFQKSKDEAETQSLSLNLNAKVFYHSRKDI